MTKDTIQDNNDEIIFDQLEELMDLANAPCTNSCANHSNMVALVKYLARMMKTAFLNQAEIKELLTEVKNQQREIIRMRKVGLWGITIIGGAFLVQFGGFIFQALKAGMGF